jgi:hyperpolarization activated cyclic nucleotide-gated potassium channel 2
VRIIHLFRLFHMKRLLRALRWFGYGLEEKLHFSFSEGPMQVAKLGMLVMITAHWMGCLNFMLARMWHFPEDSWVVAADLVGASLGAQYAWSLFKVPNSEVYLLALHKMMVCSFEANCLILAGHGAADYDRF